MKWTVIFGALLVAFWSCNSARPYKPLWIDRAGEICVERPEENGRLNIMPAEVIIEDGKMVPWDRQLLTLIGGQTACAVLPATNYHVRVSSYDPYKNGNSNEPESKFWKSETLTVAVSEGKRVELWLCGGGVKGYSKWVLKRAYDRTIPQCEWEKNIP